MFTDVTGFVEITNAKRFCIVAESFLKLNELDAYKLYDFSSRFCSPIVFFICILFSYFCIVFAQLVKLHVTIWLVESCLSVSVCPLTRVAQIIAAKRRHL